MIRLTTPSCTVAPGRISKRGEPTWEIACLFPAQGDWTVEQYLELDTNWLIEYTDGCLEVLPMPTLFHQLIVDFLHELLKDFVKKHATGKVLFAPLPVKLSDTLYREPDIVYLRPERIKDVHGQPQGADLVIEVVSEGKENRERDLVEKPRVYAEAGISEYWIVDPQQRQIQVLTLEGKAYRVHGCFSESQTATSVLFPGFSVDVKDVFAVGEA
jgi:Uma2 family endonuclease